MAMTFVEPMPPILKPLASTLVTGNCSHGLAGRESLPAGKPPCGPAIWPRWESSQDSHEVVAQYCCRGHSHAEITMTHIQQVHDVVARTLWGEARGEGVAGQIAVAWVIRNRVHDANPRSWWGEGYIGVCHKSWQFSCWNPGDPNYPYLSGARPIPQAQWAQALAVAEQVIAGRTTMHCAFPHRQPGPPQRHVRGCSAVMRSSRMCLEPRCRLGKTPAALQSAQQCFTNPGRGDLSQLSVFFDIVA